MEKITKRKYVHTIFNLVLWGIFVLINLISIYLLSDIRLLKLSLTIFLVFFFIYLVTGIFFDFITHSLSKRKEKQLAIIFRTIFIIISVAFSLFLYYWSVVLLWISNKAASGEIIG